MGVLSKKQWSVSQELGVIQATEGQSSSCKEGVNWASYVTAPVSVFSSVKWEWKYLPLECDG